MAEIEKKLNMSLDDLAKQERRQHHGSHGGRGQGGQQQWDQQGRRPYQEQQGGRGAGNRPYQYNQNGNMQYGQWQQQAGLQQQMYPQQQQQRGYGGPQRRDGKQSVFARLSGSAPGQQVQMQQPALPARRQQQQRPQLQQHQQQPQPQQPAPPPKPPKLQFRVNASDAYVILSHNKIDIVKVGPAGDVILDSSGDRSTEMLAAFNTALAPVKISVKATGPDPETWSVSDGRGLLRFADGMKIPAKGHLTAGRAMVLMQAFAAGSSKAAAAAAQEASRQAAIAAGILPATAAAAAAATDAAGDAPAESAEAAQIRRLKAQGRYQPY